MKSEEKKIQGAMEKGRLATYIDATMAFVELVNAAEQQEGVEFAIAMNPAVMFKDSKVYGEMLKELLKTHVKFVPIIPLAVSFCSITVNLLRIKDGIKNMKKQHAKDTPKLAMLNTLLEFFEQHMKATGVEEKYKTMLTPASFSSATPSMGFFFLVMHAKNLDQILSSSIGAQIGWMKSVKNLFMMYNKKKWENSIRVKGKAVGFNEQLFWERPGADSYPLISAIKVPSWDVQGGWYVKIDMPFSIQVLVDYINEMRPKAFEEELNTLVAEYKSIKSEKKKLTERPSEEKEQEEESSSSSSKGSAP